MKKPFNSHLGSLGAVFLSVMAVLFISCSQDQFSDGQIRNGRDVTVSVSMDMTKTVVEGTSIKWVNGDDITLLTFPQGGTGYYPSKFMYSSEGQGGAKFKGRIEDYGDFNSFYAFYPYREDILTPKDFHISVNKEPVQVGNGSTAHLAGPEFPLYGKQLNVQGISNISIGMVNILSVARFTVTNKTDAPIVVKSLEFTSSKYIAGPFSANMTTDEPSWTAKDGASTKVVLSVKDGEEIAAGDNSEFFVGIIPHTCLAGEKLKVKITATSEGKEVVFYRLITLTSDTTFYSGYRKQISCNFDTEHSTDPWPESESQTPEHTPEYYYKVTATPENWEGTYLIVNEDNLRAFSEEADHYIIPIEIVDGKIATLPALVADQVTVTTSPAGAGKFDVRTASGKYLYGLSSGILFESNVYNSNTYYNTFAVSNGKVVMSSSYGQSQKRFCYTNGGFTYVNDEDGAYAGASVALYRLGEPEDVPGGDPTKEDQNISFSASEFNWTIGSGYAIGGSYSIPAVSGAQTPVTYESSNTNVASISGSNIIINAAGTTVIKATAAETDKYNRATATVTLNILSSSEPTTSAYVKVTSAPSSWDGTYLVVDEVSGKAFAPFTANASAYAVNVTINNGQIVSDGTIDRYAITVSDAGVNHANSNVSGLRAYNVRNADGMYIWWSSNFGEYDSARLVANTTNTASNSGTTYEYYHTFKYDGGVQMASAIHTGSGNAYFMGYSNNAFAYSSSASSNRVQLYKLSGGTTPGQQSQNISFAQSSVTWTLGSACEIGGTYAIQQLSGTYYTAVSYTSSNPSVATIVEGNIRVQGAGSTTITATAEASASYSEAKASYTLTINNGSTPAGYELITSAPADWNGTYLMVSADKSYLFNGETGGSSSSYYGGSSSNRVALSGSDFNGNIITNTSYSQYAFTITKSGNNYYIKKGNNYYYCSYSSNSSTGIATSTSQSNAAWTFEGVTSSYGFQFYQYENNQNQYIYYKDSESTFKFGQSGKGVGILLYKLNDGTIPDQPSQPDQPGQGGDYFVKLTSAPSSWDGTYLVVDENSRKAFAYNSSSSYSANVTINNGQIAWTSDLDNIAVRVTDAGLNHPNVQIAQDLSSGTLRAYNVKTKNGQFIYASQSEIQVASTNTKDQSGSGYGYGYGGGSSTTRTYYHVFNYKNGAVYMISSGDYEQGNSSAQYYYSLAYSSNKFAYGQGKSALAQVQLYKLNGGTTPGGDTPVTPTPSGTSFNLENSYLSQYLDAAATSYSNSTTNTIVATYSGTSSTRDLPNPVSLSWSGNATSISIYEGPSASGNAFKTQSFNSSSSVEVFNLIPGKTYTYRTSNGQTGTFNTTGRRRMIKVSDNASENHARNCRDLGGIKTRKGETLNYKLMYRGTNMDQVTTEEKNILLDELGIKLDQDLRGERSSSPLGNGVKFSNEKYDSQSIANQDGNNMKTTVNDVLTSVINGNPVYIHCYIGSDRTGHMCMLYEALLGCDLKECDIDYEITSFASKMVYGTRTRGSGNESSFRSKFVKSPYNADSIPEAVENYVINTLGISRDTVRAFRRAMGVSETL